MVREETILIMSNNSVNRKTSSCDESLNKSKDTKESIGEVNYKTELCRTWVEKNFCPYKEKCRFAHGKKDLHDKIISSKNYKQKECMSFYQKGFCPYGPRCHFKHEERTLGDVNRTYYTYLLNSRNTLEKLFLIGNDIRNNVDIRLFELGGPKLKVFEKIRGPPPIKFINYDVYNFNEIKLNRELYLPRKFLNSYM
jgi:hypothetical protein